MNNLTRQFLLNLRNTWIDSDIKQSEMAEVLYIRKNNLSRALSGRYDLRISSVLRMLDVLGYELVIRKKDAS